MFVAQPTSAAGGGATVVTAGGTPNGSVDGAGTNGGAAGSYVIQGGYMLGSGGGGAAGNSQSYSHTARASPATVSMTEGEESSVPSADKKVCRGAKRRNFFEFCSHPPGGPQSPLSPLWWHIRMMCHRFVPWKAQFKMWRLLGGGAESFGRGRYDTFEYDNAFEDCITSKCVVASRVF